MPTIDDVLDHLTEATTGLITAISGLTDAEAREPSLLPNWTRGHVLTHLARNAEGGTRLLNWALTGVPSYEYPSVEDRAAAIEAGASRPAAVLIADVRATAEALADVAARPVGQQGRLTGFGVGQPGDCGDQPGTCRGKLV